VPVCARDGGGLPELLGKVEEALLSLNAMVRCSGDRGRGRRESDGANDENERQQRAAMQPQRHGALPPGGRRVLDARAGLKGGRGWSQPVYHDRDDKFPLGRDSDVTRT
jgi:hypothetical protein